MKNIKIFVVAIFIIMSMTACSFNPMLSLYDNDSKIASDSNTYNLSNCEQTIEEQRYNGSIEKFEGMDTIWTYDASGNENEKLTYNISVYSGKMKLVLIAPDNSLTTIAEITSETNLTDMQTYNLELTKGTNRIKIVGGENTKLDIKFSIPVGEIHELG